MSDPAPMLFTIGHSNRSSGDFLKMLTVRGITKLIDIRTLPRSAKLQHFNKDALEGFLAIHNVTYTHIKELGGYRKPRPDSLNRGLVSESFRGYAD